MERLGNGMWYSARYGNLPAWSWKEFPEEFSEEEYSDRLYDEGNEREPIDYYDGYDD